MEIHQHVKLYIHIGTEKTGSSFLQKVCARNRDWLEHSGLFFPTAGRDEKRLREGTISPGNARELAALIDNDRWDQVDVWLAERIAQTRAQSCDRLLLSHELLFCSFARDGAIDRFVTCLRQLGVDEANALLVIRDPVDHAISLYKHRGKNGEVEPVQEWIRVKYSTVSDLDGFVGNANPSHMNVVVRKYSKKPEALENAFFVDWLGLSIPPNSVDGAVNPSLTLSEIELLKHFADTRPQDVPNFYRNMLAVPHDQKAENENLELELHRVVSNYLADFGDTWMRLGELVKNDGGLHVPVRQSADLSMCDSFSFSETQLRVIAVSHNESRSIRYALVSVVNQYVRPYLGKLKRALSS